MLEIAGIVASLIAVGMSIFIVLRTSLWPNKKEMEAAARIMFFDAVRAGSIIRFATSSMKDDLSDKERDVLGTIIWRTSQVPLVWILKNHQEKDNLLKALADPRKYPWESKEQNQREQTTQAVSSVAKFEIYKDKSGEFRWRLVAHNGQVIARSEEGYKTMRDAQNGIASVNQAAPDAIIVDKSV
jgi:uncharacterized protein